MKIGILGTGMVGQIVGNKIAEIGHDVQLGTRTPHDLTTKRGQQGVSLGEWLEQAGGRAQVSTFAETAAHGDLVINATSGTASLAVLEAAGAENLAGKILMDISNPLDFSQGMPPSLSICNTDSLGEQIQRAFPQVKVVKTLNTVNASVMVDPGQVANGEHHLFVCGDDADAKSEVTGYLQQWFEWKHVIDLGDISMARGTEMYLPLWIRMWGALGTSMFNIRIVQ